MDVAICEKGYPMPWVILTFKLRNSTVRWGKADNDNWSWVYDADSNWSWIWTWTTGGVRSWPSNILGRAWNHMVWYNRVAEGINMILPPGVPELLAEDLVPLMVNDLSVQADRFNDRMDVYDNVYHTIGRYLRAPQHDPENINAARLAEGKRRTKFIRSALSTSLAFFKTKQKANLEKFWLSKFLIFGTFTSSEERCLVIRNRTDS